MVVRLFLCEAWGTGDMGAGQERNALIDPVLVEAEE